MSRVVKNTLLVALCLALLVPAVLLVSGVLSYQVYVVHTGSMSPTIPSKSAVIVEKGVYHLGQVISFGPPNGVVTHRLVKRKADGTLVTKGDANRTVDPGSVQASKVIGGVVAAPRMLGYWLQYLKNPAGLASLFMTIVCLWLIYSTTTAYATRQERSGARTAEKRSASLVPAAEVAVAVIFDSQSVPQADVTLPPRVSSHDLARPAAERRDEPSSAWAPKPWELPVFFRCSRCTASFSSIEELRSHAAGHGGRAREERQRLCAASRFVGRPFIVGAPQPAGPAQERKAG